MRAVETVGDWLVYGAYGYTGEIVVRHAVERGLRPVVAGRRGRVVESLAGELGLEARVFGLDNPNELRSALAGIDAVLHCAGPFVRTGRRMVDACLAAKCHYLDITGEIAVLEDVLGRGREAVDAGIALLPGVGFDVVPTDCLAAKLAAALPEATLLELGFTGSRRAGWSPGTLKTMVEALPFVAAERRNKRIVPLPLGAFEREIGFSCGPRRAVAIAWGDLSTAFHSTGIENIRVYGTIGGEKAGVLTRLRRLLGVAGARPLKTLLQWWIGRTVRGPGSNVRESARSYLWGRAADDLGNEVTITAEAPEGYTLTALASVECVSRVLAGDVPPGAWTPSQAFGAELLDAIPGVVVSW